MNHFARIAAIVSIWVFVIFAQIDILKLSVLIPVYNWNLQRLFNELNEQLVELDWDWEVLCLDDGSAEYTTENKSLARNLGFEFHYRENRGRSVTRNELAEWASGDWFLFLDCDSGLVKGNFLKKYIESTNRAEVVYGGTVYQADFPGRDFALHWNYGKKKEALDSGVRNKDPFRSFKTNNFLVSREVFSRFKLDESIRTYGYEDLMWAEVLKVGGVSILHIDNPVLHRGLNSTEKFLRNTSEAVVNLWKLHDSGKLHSPTPLLKCFFKLRKLRLEWLVRWLFVAFHKVILGNLRSSSPWLPFFALFKLSLLSQLAKKASAFGSK